MGRGLIRSISWECFMGGGFGGSTRRAKVDLSQVSRWERGD